jgi:hypothetical protein
MAKPNYAVRPAKHIERKMLCEAFSRLFPFGDVSSYRYIGFGGFYFRDFAIFHRVLGITNMVSIEIDQGNRERYQFNTPYNCIDLKFGASGDVLPSLSWDARTILWLDYTRKLDSDGLADVRWFLTNAQPGSVLVVTVNCQADHPNDKPVETLKGRFADDRVVPSGIVISDLKGWGTGQVSRRILKNWIDDCLADINGVRAANNGLRFRQLFNFQYADDARMLTVGGILYEQGQQAVLAHCGFDSLDFVRGNDQAFSIEVPVLTSRELRHLDRMLPQAAAALTGVEGIPMGDLEKYTRVYRYFPNYADTDV